MSATEDGEPGVAGFLRDVVLHFAGHKRVGAIAQGILPTVIACPTHDGYPLNRLTRVAPRERRTTECLLAFEAKIGEFGGSIQCAYTPKWLLNQGAKRDDVEGWLFVRMLFDQGLDDVID